MTVSTDENTVTATGDGSTTEFSFPYLVFQSSHLTITIDGVTTTSWSAATYGDPNGVTVTFTAAPADQTSIVIQRIVPNTQETDLENFDGNPADVTEKQFDLLVMADQQITEKAERAILSPITTTLTSNTITGTIDTTTRALTITTAGPASSALADLALADIDVTLTGEASGDYLRYDGASWVNDTAAETLTAIGAQPLDTGLTSIAGLTTAANKMIYTTASDTYSTADLTAFARTILDDADAAAVRATISSPSDYILTGCSVYQTATTSIATGGWTSVLFDTEEYDDDDWHSTSTNTSRITFDFTGRVSIKAIGAMADTNNGIRAVKILKNGTTDVALNQSIIASSGTVVYQPVSRDLSVVPTDYIELQIYNNSGAADNSITGVGGCQMQVQRIK